MARIVALYELPLHMKLARACLGRTYFALIAGRCTRLTVPGVELVEQRYVDLTGEVAVDHRFMVQKPAVEYIPRPPVRDNGCAADEYWWGSVGEWRTSPPDFEGAWIRAVIFEFDIADELIGERDVPGWGWLPEGAAVDELFAGVAEWFEMLLTWIGVVDDQDTQFDNPHVRPSSVGDGLSLLAVKANGPSATEWPRRHFLDTTNANGIEANVFRRIITAANRGQRPPDAHQFLRDARGDLVRKRYRKAVIDAGTAVELVLAGWRFSHPKPGKDPHPAKPTLGVCVQHTTALLPADIKTALVDIRNDAIHNGLTPSHDQASRAIEIAVEIVRTLDPLAVLGN